MSHTLDILNRFAGTNDAAGPLFVPDLTLWYEHHEDDLPDRWSDASLADIARSLGVPAWSVVKPWQIESPGLEIQTSEDGDERITRYETSTGPLTARWTKGSDGTWWQLEYPVKSADDLTAALEVARARTYVLDTNGLVDLEEAMGEDGVVALEIPGRPYADLLYEFLGMSEGPIILMENPPEVQDVLDILESKLQRLIREIADLPGRIVFAHDNLDAQFVSPPVFQEHLASSYRATADELARHDRYLLVHAGGPIAPLVGSLAGSGVDGIEGIAGPPQSDATLAEARQLAGEEMVLWGGIPQDFVLATRDRAEFEEAVSLAARDAAEDGRAILGVADRVPVDAEIDRLEAIPELIDRAIE